MELVIGDLISLSSADKEQDEEKLVDVPLEEQLAFYLSRLSENQIKQIVISLRKGQLISESQYEKVGAVENEVEGLSEEKCIKEIKDALPEQADYLEQSKKMASYSKFCSHLDCDKEVENENQRIELKLYCQQHYHHILREKLIHEYLKWPMGYKPRKKFLKYLGRNVEENDWKTDGGSYLSSARIRDRGYDFQKLLNGCTFSIVRHPGAWSDNQQMKEVIQHWEADIKNQTLRLLETEDNRQ